MGRPKKITASYLDEMKELKQLMIKSAVKQTWYAMMLGYDKVSFSKRFTGLLYMPEEKRKELRKLIEKRSI